MSRRIVLISDRDLWLPSPVTRSIEETRQMFTFFAQQLSCPCDWTIVVPSIWTMRTWGVHTTLFGTWWNVNITLRQWTFADFVVFSWYVKLQWKDQTFEKSLGVTAVPFNVVFEIRNLGFLWAQNSLFGHSGRLFGPIIDIGSLLFYWLLRLGLD